MNLEKIHEIRKKRFTPAVCVHCGEVWWLPKYIAKQYGANRQYECTYCLNKMKNLYGRI